MVRPNGYGIRDPQEYEPKVIAICAGCDEPIREDQEHVGDDPELIVHDEWECAYLAYKHKILGL